MGKPIQSAKQFNDVFEVPNPRRELWPKPLHSEGSPVPSDETYIGWMIKKKHVGSHSNIHENNQFLETSITYPCEYKSMFYLFNNH